MAYNTGTDPTLAEEITGYFIPENFSKQTLMHTMSNLVVAASVNTAYRSDLHVGSVVYIPVWSEGSAAEVTPGTELTASDLVGTGVSITVNKWYGTRIEESEMMNVQDHVGYLEKGAQSCGYTIAKKVDTDLGALFSTLYSSSVYGADGQTFTDEIVRTLMENLDEGDVPEDDRVIIGDPSMKSDLLNIDKFVRNDYVRGGAIETGQFGNIYNMKVKITNNLTDAGTGNYGVMMHRDALGLVLQKDPYSQKIPMPWKHMTVYQVKVIYGVAELRDTFGRAFYTRSD